jgi:E3 SUMO-protein ligase PIAS1
MVFCTAEYHNYKPAEISFPNQVEMRCNGADPKANLKGIKGKHGSTRPADITSFIRKREPNFRNDVELTYALTNKVRPPRLRLNSRISFCTSDI